MAMGSRSCSDARRTFDAESLAASPDEDLPTGSNPARSIWFWSFAGCLVQVADRLFEVHLPVSGQDEVGFRDDGK